MNRKSQQLGMAFEVFLLILILILFTMFWSGFARSTFLAGILKIDDSVMKHSCVNMLPVLIGTDYIKSTDVGDSASVNLLLDYLKFEGDVEAFNNATFFYEKITNLFPTLKGKVGVTIVTTEGTSVGGIHGAGVNLARRLELLKSTRCEFPLYSINPNYNAIIILEVYV
ncbi:MAG TPA: hypothetical protein VI790_01340 [Candidatus Nanoarchaeia archaeon]|nr:hypothetical protein [Candidatus Nanoarchaeia archaeon]